MRAVHRNRSRLRGRVDQALVDAATVEAGDADRARRFVAPVDVAGIDGHAAGRRGPRDEVGINVAPVEISARDGRPVAGAARTEVRPVDISPGTPRQRRTGNDQHDRSNREPSQHPHRTALSGVSPVGGDVRVPGRDVLVRGQEACASVIQSNAPVHPVPLAI
jgi:hypothetical protein